MKFLNMIVFCIILFYHSFQVKGLNRTNEEDNEDDDDRGSGSICSLPILRNGKVRSKHKGQVFIFRCLSPYKLLGMSTALCVDGSLWIPPGSNQPICIRSGCPSIRKPSNGIKTSLYRGAALSFDCKSILYSLIGSSFLICDGVSWNGTRPECQKKENSGFLACTFNEESECLKWKNNYFKLGNYTPTFRPGSLDTFAYLESSYPLSENDYASLTSSLLTTEEVKCVKVNYIMKGPNVGSLVFSQELQGNKSLVVGVLQGDQGNEWKVAAFPTVQISQDESFRVRVQARMESGYFGVIALQKIELLPNVDDCKGDEILPVKRHISSISCFNRCGQIQTRENEATWSEGNCLCIFNCSASFDKVLGCCSDYNEMCLSVSLFDNAFYHPFLLFLVCLFILLFPPCISFRVLARKKTEENDSVIVQEDLLMSMRELEVTSLIDFKVNCRQ